MSFDSIMGQWKQGSISGWQALSMLLLLRDLDGNHEIFMDCATSVAKECGQQETDAADKRWAEVCRATSRRNMVG